MSPIGHHIRARILDDRVIATTPALQRLVTRIVLEQGRRDSLLCTSLAGNHLHLNALCSDTRSSRLIQRVTSSVKQRLGLPMGFTHYPHEPIRDNRHLWYSVRYHFTQQRHHRLPPEQTIDGTNLPDLLGMRHIGAYTRQNLQEWLPQLRTAQLVKWLGVDELRMADGSPSDVVEATLAAAALDSLGGSSPRTIAARRVVVQILKPRLTTTELISLLAVRPRTLTWLKSGPVDQALLSATRLQLGARADLRVRREAWDAEKTA